MGSGRQDERSDPAPERTESDRLLGDGVLSPLARPGNGNILAAVELLGELRAVVGPEREDRGSGTAPERGSAPLRVFVPDLIEIFREQLVEGRLL